MFPWLFEQCQIDCAKPIKLFLLQERQRTVTDLGVSPFLYGATLENNAYY